MKKIAGFLLKLFGWKVKGTIPVQIKKMVLIEAPHTSNWDYLWGMLSAMSIGRRVTVIIKKELFFWPLGVLLRALGGVPIDRKGSSNKVDAIAKLFKESDELILSITPEGTRSKATEWKKGFYYIAMKANVPVLLASLDYKKKEGVFGELIYLTGDYNKDFEKIYEFYKDVTPKYPGKFSIKKPGK